MLVENEGCPFASVAASTKNNNTTSMTVAERKAAAEAASIISREKRQSGSSGAGPYAAYIEGMGGVPVVLGVLVLMASAQLAAIFSNLQLSAWVKLPYAQQQERRGPVVVYLGLVGAVIALAIVRALVASERMLRASQRLHDGMIHALLRTPIAFYDTNPTGRIVNRTTKVGQVRSGRSCSRALFWWRWGRIGHDNSRSPLNTHV